MQLAIDRKSFVEILAEGQRDVSGAMLPPPAGCGARRPKFSRRCRVTVRMCRPTAPRPAN
jgi:hypothetical protein